MAARAEARDPQGPRGTEMTLRLAAAMLLAVGVTSSITAGATPPGTVKFSGGGLSLVHPVNWRAGLAGKLTYGPFHLIVALSNQPLRKPACHSVTQPNGDIVTSCDPILD